MQREAAKKLIKDTFERPFDKEQFTRFAKNLLNHVEDARFTYRGNLIFDDFRDQVKTLERIGKYEDAKGNKLDILIVQLAKDTGLERARASQRKFVAKYLKGSRGGDLKDAALVAFVSPDDQDWRFSYVKMEYKFDAKGRVKEDFTPARRYSFLVGTNENSHTAQSRLLPILEDTDRNPTLSQIEESFSVEKVTKEFFEQYRELYHKVKDALDNLINADKEIRANFKERGVDSVDFAKKLLGQIVFLYFLQKKGWFGVKRKAAWGTGSKNFLRELFRGDHGEYNNFFDEILEPLFYNTLAVERPENYSDRFDCKIPFLNGGLFDPLNNYDWVHTDILLSNELFSNDEKTKNGDRGTGILDVFDRYNFTVKEDEPLEKEVAVDPEMLGKVFENLLEIKDRKSKGTYYTPREIVHYMCQESLVSYLATGLEGTVARDDIETLIMHGEAAMENDSRVMESGGETNTYKFKLPEGIRENAKALDVMLANIKVCDPAVGSGAFLVGMMTEITRSRQTLAVSLSNSEGRTPYKLKRDAIQNSLYGVDLDPGAVEIAKLRLWLSLIVDEDDYTHIKPLPNLDYKIMQGNSLLEEYEGIKLINERFFEKQVEIAASQDRVKMEQSRLQREYFELHSRGKLTKIKKAELEKQLKSLEAQSKALLKPRTSGQSNLPFAGKSEEQSKAEQLLHLHESFFTTYHKREKDELKKRINQLTWELIETTLIQNGKKEKLSEVRRFQEINTQPFFLWRLNFADVFREKHGFDVVIANPPYVRQEAIKELKPALKAEGYECFAGTADLLVYFYERGVKLLHSGGTITLITSNKFYRAGYGEKLRGFLTRELTLDRLIDFGDAPVFEAIAYASILTGIRSIPSQDTSVLGYSWEKGVAFDRIAQIVPERGKQISQSALTAGGWHLESPQVLRLLEKLRGSGKSLGEYCNGRFYRGVTTGLNEAFVVDRRTRDRLIREHKSSLELLKPFLRGRDIKRWCVDPKDLWLIFTRRGTDIDEYPAIKEHLHGLKDSLIPGKPGGRKPGSYKWFEIQDNIGYWKEFEQPKIVFPDIAQNSEFSWDSQNHYLLNTCYILPTDEKWLLGLLNSRLVFWFYTKVSNTIRGNFVRFISQYVEGIPVPTTTTEERKGIEQLVEKILSIKKRNTAADVSELERALDQIIYGLFGLKQEEIQIVKNTGRTIDDNSTD